MSIAHSERIANYNQLKTPTWPIPIKFKRVARPTIYALPNLPNWLKRDVQQCNPNQLRNQNRLCANGIRKYNESFTSSSAFGFWPFCNSAIARNCSRLAVFSFQPNDGNKNRGRTFECHNQSEPGITVIGLPDVILQSPKRICSRPAIRRQRVFGGFDANRKLVGLCRQRR